MSARLSLSVAKAITRGAAAGSNTTEFAADGPRKLQAFYELPEPMQAAAWLGLRIAVERGRAAESGES
jgi:hypothetical protein